MLVLLLIVSNSYFLLGQQLSKVDARWKLIGENAIVPVRDLVTIAAHRLYLQDRAGSFKAEAVERGKESLALRQAITKKDGEIKILNEQLALAKGELAMMDEKLASCKSREDKLRPWATVGKIGTVTVSMAVIGIVTERIINSAKP